MVADSERPIGMFDSGLGGLTVARATIDLLPHEDLVYFGDTARTPWGPRDPEEIRRFSLQIMDWLMEQDVKLVVVACNAAESSAFYEGKGYDIPIVTVIEPGVQAAMAATRNRRIGVIGTVATIASGAYDAVVSQADSEVHLFSQACPKFVDFVEAGDTASEALIAAAEEYLVPLQRADVDTLVLGCTHYPLLSGVIQYVMGDQVVLVSSADPTANEVYRRLLDENLLNPGQGPGRLRFAFSGDTDPELGRRFLGPQFKGVEHRPWEKG